MEMTTEEADQARRLEASIRTGQVIVALCRCRQDLEARYKLYGKQYVNSEFAPTQAEVIAHLIWSCEEAAGFAEEKPEKAERWLGFIQGALWAITGRVIKLGHLPSTGDGPLQLLRYGTSNCGLLKLTIQPQGASS